MPSRPLGRDWCVSRQLWWGHRIPAYLVVEEHMKVGRMKRMGGLGIVEREVATAQESEGFQCQSQLPACPGQGPHCGIGASKLALLHLTARGGWQFPGHKGDCATQ